MGDTRLIAHAETASVARDIAVVTEERVEVAWRTPVGTRLPLEWPG